jgi:hypothetical protein
MESHGVAGRIHVTERVARAAEARFDFEPRASTANKGKGTMTTFLLVGAKRSATTVEADAPMGA